MSRPRNSPKRRQTLEVSESIDQIKKVIKESKK